MLQDGCPILSRCPLQRLKAACVTAGGVRWGRLGPSGEPSGRLLPRPASCCDERYHRDHPGDDDRNKYVRVRPVESQHQGLLGI
jgi:hypothetical protein